MTLNEYLYFDTASIIHTSAGTVSWLHLSSLSVLCVLRSGSELEAGPMFDDFIEQHFLNESFRHVCTEHVQTETFKDTGSFYFTKL